MVGFFVSPSLARGACVQLVFIAEELRGLGRGPCFVEKKPSFFTPIAVAGIFDFFSCSKPRVVSTEDHAVLVVLTRLGVFHERIARRPTATVWS